MSANNRWDLIQSLKG